MHRFTMTIESFEFGLISLFIVLLIVNVFFHQAPYLTMKQKEGKGKG